MLDAVNPTGETRLLVATDSVESGTYAWKGINFYASEWTGTTNDPKLTVTYTTPPAGTPALTARLIRSA
jgi:hypothetical protein